MTGLAILAGWMGLVLILALVVQCIIGGWRRGPWRRKR